MSCKCHEVEVKSRHHQGGRFYPLPVLQIFRIFFLTVWVSGFSARVLAQVEQSIFWKVSTKKGKTAGYLFGTMHTSDSLVNRFSGEVLNAIHLCPVMACEIDMNRVPGASLSFVFMRDSALRDFFSEEDYQILNRELATRFDATTLAMMRKLKPMYTMGLLDMPAEMAQTVVMDEHLQRYASERGKTIFQLETMEEAAAAVDRIPLRDQAQMLYEMVVDTAATNTSTRELFRYYYHQQLDSMYAMYVGMKVPGQFNSSLVEGRNLQFGKRLLKVMKKTKVFCAVGCLHLTGPTGLIAQLRKAGYRVEPVVFHWGG